MTKCRAVGVFCLFIATAAGVAAQTSITAEVAFKSRYLFAGIPFATVADGAVTQGTLTVSRTVGSAGAVSLYGFGVLDHESENLIERDFYADYYHQVSDLVGVFVGGALYNFLLPKQAGGTYWELTPEAYGGIVLATLLSPTLYVAHDFDLGDGTHATLTLSHAVDLGDSGASLTLIGNMDYNAEYYATSKGLSYADIGAALAVPLGPVTVTPSFVVQRRLDDAFESDFVVDEEVFGIAASYTFGG
jgi:hypothetical protein